MKLFLVIATMVLGQAAWASAASLVENQLAFSDELTKSLYDSPNECTSSLGVSMCFGLIYPCMAGEAKEQTKTVLGFPQDNSYLVWKDYIAQIVSKYDGTTCIYYGDERDDCPRKPLVDIQNSLWVDEAFTLDSNYNSIISGYLHSIDFKSENAGGLVNAWTSEQTRGLIAEIVQNGPLTPLMLLAVNTIYLKANWNKQFSPMQTNQDVFYTDPQHTSIVNSNAHFMHILGRFFYSSEVLPGYQVLELPFSWDVLSFTLVLPTGVSVHAVGAAEVIEARSKVREIKRMAIGIPKFCLESEYKEHLVESLKMIGLEAPFYGGLCVYENDCTSFLDLLIQKTFIQVDETGVEAAAVTAGGITGSDPYPDNSDPILFLADHPFQFFIHDEITQAILFEGRIGNPEPPKGGSTPLTSKHSDSNFWSANFGVSPRSWNNDDDPSWLAKLFSGIAAMFTGLCAFTAIFG